jgi:MFS superfamily sulfate permease-like transporter
MASAFTQGRDTGNRTGAASRLASTFAGLMLLALAACGGGVAAAVPMAAPGRWS